ncbi:unnamed protein product, partial [Prorocentrum cordatum]
MGAETRQKDKIVTTGVLLWDQWQSESCAAMRSAHETLNWTYDEMAGDFLGRLGDTFAMLSVAWHLEECEFFILNESQLAKSDPRVHQHKEDELASVFGHLQTGLNLARIKRIKEDYENCQWLLDNCDTRKGVNELIHRSVWKHMSKLQVYEVIRGSGFVVTDRLRQWAIESNSGIGQSQSTEDCLNKQKNYKPYVNKMGAISGAFEALIDGDVLGGKNRFVAVKVGQVSPGRDMVLDPEAHAVKVKTSPQELRQLTSFDKGSWMLAMGHFNDGAAVMYPVAERDVPGANGACYELDRSDFLARELCHAVLDVDQWDAAPVKWKSPYSQLIEHGGHGAQVDGFADAAIRVIRTGPVEALKAVVARRCFGNLNQSQLVKYAAYLGCELEDTTSLLHVCESLIRFCIEGIKTDDLRAILSLRAAEMVAKESHALEMLNDIEDAHAVIGARPDEWKQIMS